jgi:uncharacterized damage-inducible protein DinB
MSAIDLLAYLMDEAFQGRGIVASNESQALMTNLATVDTSMWRARLPGSIRTIESIALHVASCKVMYADHAFGTRQLTWESREVQPWPDGSAPMAETLDFLRASHAALMAHVTALSDDELATPRYANWGELRETRWLLSTLLQHDIYHAGEINHIRALLAGEDRWNWQIHEGIDPLATSETQDVPADGGGPRGQDAR